MKDEVSCELVAVFAHKNFSVRKSGLGTRDGFYDKDLFDAFQKDKFLALLNFGFMARPQDISPSLEFLHKVAAIFIGEASRDGDIEISRKAGDISEETALEIFHSVPFALGMENLGLEWIRWVWAQLALVFDKELEESPLPLGEYLKQKNQSITLVGRVYFHLIENKGEAQTFAFLATYSTGTSQRVRHLPLKNALLEYKGEVDKLLQLLKTVRQVSEKSRFIANLADSGDIFSPLIFSKKDAHTFLSEIPIYKECGIICRIPPWWSKRSGVKIAAVVGEKSPATLGLKEVLSFEPRLMIDGVELSKQEALSLLNITEGLTNLKDKWVEVDHRKLRIAIDMLEKSINLSGLTLARAMQLQAGMASGGAAVPLEVKNGQWLKQLRQKMLSAAKSTQEKTGEGFKGRLREYQEKGFNWLCHMEKIGLGCLLADDMGLGKTVQVLALLERLKGEVLLVIPASLICNWQNEIKRFLPSLNYKVIHSKGSHFEKGSAQLYITTYGMLQRDAALQENNWDTVILDEAQGIKNSGSKQSKTARLLNSRFKIALTGTPVENRLSDLWSIFDFLNPGMLGSAKEFKNFTKILSQDTTGYARLREIVSPFILRRLKTDSAVIKDLPEKVEVKELVELTKKQAVLYGAHIKMVQKKLNEAQGISRSGLILSSIIKLKQICNHVDLYLGKADFDPLTSGKFQMLGELCETIAQKQERVLVFTQFREMTEPIAKFLAKIFGQNGFVLHGGTTVKKRGEITESFNGEEYVPFLVLSLKAGGVGLNLTGANHVIHFDRWWNPAVENQATDRAFRIGQHKNVMVHKLITAGTLEEKIDKIIQEKEQLAREVITSGESLITTLSNQEVMNLMRLEP